MFIAVELEHFRISKLVGCIRGNPIYWQR